MKPFRLRPPLHGLVLVAALAALALAPSAASAGTTRPFQNSFTTASPGNVAVDQSNGDVYVVNTSFDASSISRFDSSGAPKDFTAGPDAGTNTLTGFQAGCCGVNFAADIAIDNSGGPLDGTVYVADPHNLPPTVSGEPNGQKVLAFARSGAQLGSFAVSSPCGLAVDQSNGDLYASTTTGLMRFAPASSPGGAIDASDYTVTGISAGGGCAIAAGSGDVYATNESDALYRYSASDFSAANPTATGTLIDSGFTAAGVTAVEVDPKTGDIYADEGVRVSVFDPAGDLLYRFGAGAYFGASSAGIALKAAASGPADLAYVSGLGQISAFGAPTQVQVLTHPQLAAFGPDGPPACPGSADVTGTGDIDAAGGVGDLANGSNTVSNFAAASGTFQVGMSISGTGIPAGTTISTVGAGTLALSNTATATGAGVALSAGQVTSASAACGTFKVGMSISGVGIPTDTTIIAIAAGTLTLSRAPTVPGTGIALSASRYFGQLFGMPLAFDGAARSLYALDAGPPGIYGFDVSAPPTFAPLSAFAPLHTAAVGQPPGLAVDNTASPSTTAGRVYLAANDQFSGANALYGFDSADSPLAGFNPLDPATTPGAPDGDPTSLCGDAVDSAGNVWVSNKATAKILKYDSTGAYLGALDTSALGAPCQIALDTNDDLYAAIGGAVWKFTAASSYSTASATKIDSNAPGGLAVDPSTHRLYVSHADSGVAWVDTYDASGNFVDEFARSGSSFDGIAVDPANDYLYLADSASEKIRAYLPGVALPEATTKAAGALQNTSATLNGLAGNQAFAALTDCHFDYVTAAAYKTDVAAGNDGFSNLSSGGTHACDQAPGSIPLDLDTHPVSTTVTANLTKDTEYRFRLSATDSAGTTASPAGTFFTASAPSVETVGSPLRTATTARLDARIDPKRALTHYHFEYLSAADYAANGNSFSGPNVPTRAPANPADDPSAGDGNLIVLGSQEVSGLDSNTTYRYRAIADNGNPDGAAVGDGMTLTTFASDQPLSHGAYPGPPDSDRAWEQVSAPDTSGNPLFQSLAFSDAGDRALYRIAGGIPQGDTGGGFGQLFAQRPPGQHPTSGWETTNPYPPRSELGGAGWTFPAGPADLSSWVSSNADAFFAIAGPHQIYRLHADGSPEQLLDVADLPAGASIDGSELTMTSDDASRVVAELSGPADPNYPTATGSNYYDISSGAPHLLDLLPGNAVATCGVNTSGLFNPIVGQTLVFVPMRSAHWLSPDGSLLFFHSQGTGPCNSSTPTQLYMRDIPAQSTTRISPPPVSGPDCGAAFVKWVPGAVFFWSQSRLSADDTAPASCGGAQGTDGDLYRYDLTGGGLDCLTCGLDPDTDADVIGSSDSTGDSGPLSAIAVAADGSRLYFASKAALLPGVPTDGQLSIYRLDLTGAGGLAYVASDAYPGEQPFAGGGLANAVSSDGRYLLFLAKASILNSLTDSDNGATDQLYRYDDEERSLICVSCPADGSAPAGALTGSAGVLIGGGFAAPNKTPLADDGTVLFATPTPLAPADQNTPPSGDPQAGTDVYEFRDGRQLLVSDGATEWPPSSSVLPAVEGITPSGRDAFFSEPAQLTPDALDGAKRLYDARIGGGIDFPPASLPPCDLNGGGCEGPGTNPPDQPGAGSAVFSGQGNPAAKWQKPKPRHCPKNKVKRKGRCVAKKPHKKKHHKVKKHHRAANHNRRAGR